MANVANTTFEDVADTASWVAACRAKESARTDALFYDPLAERVTDERGRRIADEIVGAKNFQWAIAVRTKVLDQLITSAVSSGVDAVLNLGAGMDTRPYRLSLPATLRWYEVDQVKVIATKEERLRDQAPVCALRRVGLDLAQVGERRRLLAEVNDASKRVLVVTEGVIGYLRNEDVGALASDLAEFAHLAQWIVDYSSPMLRNAMRRRRRVRKQFRTAPHQFNPQDWESFFVQRGWAVSAMHFLVEEGERHGRPIPLPWWIRLLTQFSPSHKDQVRRMLGFAVMQPKRAEGTGTIAP